ncbi:hypothetical protein CN558_04530 [Bacillus wiedmannii]|uniref:RNA-directed DNA polymerase n=1 Tax=Bacillus cereus group TaxID=86661 RepID=UPI000BF1879C|nr:MULTISPECIES: RNA-directed DNA polymerase [Bacillus cereus group]PEO03570.1 hypothetical protein CN561_16465 [Bacillus toyonensis]PEO88245.1 hypothetical protein CN558_04530 [Bacillus wiedmannii]
MSVIRGENIIKNIKNSQKIRQGKRIFYIPDEEQSNAYNIVKLELIKKYNINAGSRDGIIKSLISHLTQGDYLNYTIPQQINLFIFRTDIKNFFPSINKHKLYQKLNNSNILSTKSMDILKEALFSTKVQGIPLGLQFSSHLAELYLEQFDSEIRKTFNPIAYFRYVDDILILQYDFSQTKQEQANQKDSTLEKIDYIFSKHNLERNTDKTEFTFYNHANLKSELAFHFLGYNFTSVKSQLKVNISAEKEKKIINKVKKYIYSYKTSKKSNKEFWTLYYKIKNTIYGVCSYDKKGSSFKFGLGYNYRFINDNTSIERIIKEIRSSIYSCNLSSYKTNTLLSIISYNKSCEEPKDILKKRFNYLKLNLSQKQLIKKRLNLPTIPLNENFSKRLFFHLYLK